MQAVQPPVVADKAAKYRGAVIEDLQLPPAVCVPRDATVGAALSIAHDHDYSQLPLVGSNRKLLGYVDVASLRAHVEAGTKKQDDKVDSAMVRFKAMPGTLGSNTYTVIEPNTGLGELEGESGATRLSLASSC